MTALFRTKVLCFRALFFLAITRHMFGVSQSSNPPYLSGSIYNIRLLTNLRGAEYINLKIKGKLIFR